MLFYQFMQRNQSTRGQSHHQIALTSCQDTDGMEWTDLMALKKKYFLRNAEKKATSEVAYKWSVEDM